MMNNLMSAIRATCACAVMAAVVACESKETPSDLGAIDVAAKGKDQGKIFAKPKSEQEIRRAYAEYLKSTDANDRFRVDALTRLAELELRASQKAMQEKEDAGADRAEGGRDDEQLGSTIDLLSASLRAYPKAKNNDVLLYQLAKAYAQKGDGRLSIERLRQLTEQFPDSPYYVESQFRIGEDAFSRRNYKTAEHAYTEVLVSAQNEIFYEKALYKRGWSKFKQQYYTEAVDDFSDAITAHRFDSREKLNTSELEQFKEYFRGVGLAFSYLGGAKAVHAYLKDKGDFDYVYDCYAALGDIYSRQERYSDAAGTYQEFIKTHRKSKKVPYARLKVIEIWQQSGFDRQVYDAVESFYLAYNPASSYWQEQKESSDVSRVIRRSLKKYVILVAGYYHSRYQKSGAEADFEAADRWYGRYRDFYATYAQSDNMDFLYAELLSQHGQHKRALHFYERAAYQNGLIVNKEAAYAAIYTGDKLCSLYPDQKEYLTKLIAYALRYVRAYPKDGRAKEMLTHAAELAFRAKEYKAAIELSDIFMANHNAEQAAATILEIKAQSYFALREFAEAETIYGGALRGISLSDQQRTDFEDKLALSIYRQGDSASRTNDVRRAIHHYSRISDIAPASKIAATGLYDAIALEMQHQQWAEAIGLIQRFQERYPKHELQLDVAKKLSAAYLNTNQGIKAAKEFERLSGIESDLSVKAAALWKAAELYASKGETKQAIQAYENYADKFKQSFPQRLEAMYQLTELYGQIHSEEGVTAWLGKIVASDRGALNNRKTDRTRYIASVAYLKLGNREKARFDTIRLTLPLKRSLKQKKAAMKKAVTLYGKASRNRVFDAVTEATYQIATIYKDFSKSLLDSDRPKNLNEEELNQYEVLLEDQAFPFEDKAIEFHELNLARTKDGDFNEWVRLSLGQLVELFPERYKRGPKQDVYVSKLE